MEVLLKSTKNTKELAEKLASKLNPNSVIAFYGDLGTGKTTFTKYLVEALGITARVQSPTFVLIRKYSKKNGEKLLNPKISIVNHVDLYRITSKEEVINLGLDEIINEKNAITVIEWAEILDDRLPKNTIKIKLEDLGKNERKASIQNSF